MAGGNMSARQKMINLMYLVFIAMMALNIDREVLSSFYSIDESLVKTNSITDSNNKAFMGVIAERAKSDPDYKVTETQAKQVTDKATSLIGYLQGLKTKLVGTEQIKDSLGDLNYSALSNLESVTSLFFINDNTPTPDGEELVQQLQAYNDYLDQLSKSPDSVGNPISYQQFKIDLSGKKEKGEGEKSWLFKTFYGQPQIAAVTTLTKLQNDVYNSEAEIIRSFLTTKMLDDIEINTFKGVISPPGALIKGANAQAFVALGAFDNGINGTATVNGRQYPVVDGKATVPIPTGSTGDFKLGGTMTFSNPSTGKAETIPLETVTYKVVDATVTGTQFTGVITADKMNVLYVGLSNPVTATVSGVEPNTIRISGPGYSGSGTKGVVRPSSVGTITLTVSGTTSEGRTVSTPVKFRVKGLPRPEAQARGRSTLSLPPSSLSRLTISANMPKDFGFDLSVNVTGFSVKVPGRPAQTVSGNSLSAASSVASAKPGSTVTIFDIKTSSSAPVPDCGNNIVIEVL